MSPHSRRHALIAGISAFALLLGPAAARAQGADPAAAADFISRTGNDLVALVNREGTPIAERRAAIAAILRRAVDIDGVGRFVIGRYWRVATPAEQREYMQLFEQIIVRNLSVRFGELRGVKYTVNRGMQRTEEDAIVSTTIERPSAAAAVVEWRVSRLENGQLRIVDVIAEGTSLRLTTRSDYAAVVQRNGGKAEGLLAALRRQLAEITEREQANAR
ncbi:MAG: ABC transporter substrate-binding protein [Alphaproteobacteria bacterium]|nr:ABC transporter substrate-binding protein [Alphaproteobacteria bacterium]